MKKIYLLLFCISTGFFASAQNSYPKVSKKHEFIPEKIRRNFIPEQKGVVLWENQFDNDSLWILDNNGTTTNDPNTGSTAQWTFQTNTSYPSGIQGGSPFSGFNSASVTNGYLFIDSDGCGGGDNDGNEIIVTATISTPIDLSNESNVVLSFSHNYRWWKDTRGVRVSGDNGLNWTQFQITVGENDPGNCMGCGPNDNYPNDQNSGNPEITSIDISAIAGGQSQVLIQFYYEDHDIWAWYWAVDDVKITRKDLNNVQNNASWVYGQSTNFAEYGRTPLSQMDSDWIIGAEVINDGVNAQSNVTLNADFGSFTATATLNDSLYADSSEYVETLYDLSMISTGIYQGTFTISSDSDQVGGPLFVDNVLERNFEITNDIYSLDGIGNHPSGTENLTSLGSNSWSDAPDGLICATYYYFNQTEEVNYVRTFITDVATPGAEIYLHVIDSLGFMNNSFDQTDIFTSFYVLTEQDSINGYFDISTSYNIGWDPNTNSSNWESLSLSAGGYYFGVELVSYGTNHVRIVDDNTVPQPGMSSCIRYPQTLSDPATIYSNGNAFAIRLNLSSSVGVNEIVTNKVSIYPNPTFDVLNISTNSNDLSELTVKDITGKTVLSQNFINKITINTENYSKGIYLIDVKNDLGTVLEKISVQ